MPLVNIDELIKKQVEEEGTAPSFPLITSLKDITMSCDDKDSCNKLVKVLRKNAKAIASEEITIVEFTNSHVAIPFTFIEPTYSRILVDDRGRSYYTQLLIRAGKFRGGKGNYYYEVSSPTLVTSKSNYMWSGLLDKEIKPESIEKAVLQLDAIELRNGRVMYKLLMLDNWVSSYEFYNKRGEKK